MNGPSFLSLPAPAATLFSHTYHPDGRPKTTLDAAGLHTYLYAGPNGALSGETITGSGLLAGAVMNYGYDDQKRRDQVTWTWGNGQSRTTGLTFDAAGRLHTVTAFGQTATYGYEPGTGRLDTLAYTGTGSLTGSWTYDERGRLDVVSWQRGVDTVSRHDYGYATDMNRRTSALRETGDEWRYGYNLRGEVETAAKAQGTAANAPLWKGLVSGYGYDGIGNRTTETVDTPTGAETLDWTPNAVNQITEREVARGKWVLGRVHPEAALTAKKDGVDLPNGSVVREGENFAVPMEAGLAAGEPAWKQMSLNASREGVGKNGATVQQTQTGSLWFAASPESLTYDEDGNLQTDGRWLYLWDAENRLKAMETQASAITAGVPAMRLEFAYDAMGRRVQKVVKSFSSPGWTTTSDLRYLYDGWNLIAEFEKHSPSLPLSQSPRLVRAYAWGRDLSGTEQGAGGVGGLVLTQQLSTTLNNGQPRSTSLAPAYDGNGNITAYLDLANGRITARLDYDAFGNPVWSELSSTVGAGERIPFGFSTKYEDRETGLLYYGYRYYAPELGRWLSRDPIEEQGGVNLYGMVGNDPVNQWDYLGLEDRSLLFVSGPDGSGMAITPIGGLNMSQEMANLGQTLTSALGYRPRNALRMNGKAVGTEAEMNVHIARVKAEFKCKFEVKVTYKYAEAASDAKQYLNQKADRHVLLAHGEPGKSGVTGVQFRVPGASYKGASNAASAIAAAYSIDEVVPANSTFFPENKIGVGCCFPGGLPNKSNGISIVKLVNNPNYNGPQFEGGFWTKFRDVYRCLCEGESKNRN